MFPLAWTLGAVAATWFVTPALATSCTAFDSDFNLYGFGINGRDFAFGPQSSWANVPTGTVMPTTGRPPFDGSNTQCFTAEYFNAIYVLNADASQPGAIHIFDATTKSWTTQQTTIPDGLDPASMVAILDHDTNVFFAMSKGVLYTAEMSDLKAASATPVVWGPTNAPNFDTSNYAPVMGLAQNHIRFLNIGGDDGLARLFVIHFAYWQPEIQYYRADNGAGTFPQKHGQTASFFTGDTQAQRRFAFVPDDLSKTYIIEPAGNTTIVIPGPPASTGFASNPVGLMGRFSASPSALVYLSPANELHYIGVDQNNVWASAGYPWLPISSSELVAAAAADPVANTGTGAAGTASATGTAASRSAGASSTGTASAASSSSTGTSNGAVTLGMGTTLVAALVGFQAWLML